MYKIHNMSDVSGCYVGQVMRSEVGSQAHMPRENHKDLLLDTVMGSYC
jgi:hypothetical protein